MGEIINPYEFSKKERKEIYKRDDFQCVMPGCRNTFGLGVAHVFVSRAKGGLGVKENGALLCQEHHQALDQKNHKWHESIKQYVEDYLKHHYGIIDKQDVIYNKWKGYAHG